MRIQRRHIGQVRPRFVPAAADKVAAFSGKLLNALKLLPCGPFTLVIFYPIWERDAQLFLIASRTAPSRAAFVEHPCKIADKS